MNPAKLNAGFAQQIGDSMAELSTEEEFASSENPYIEKFRRFFEMYYKKGIEDCIENYPEKRSINVDFSLLEKFDYTLADELIENPDLIIESAKQALKQFAFATLDTKEVMLNVRFFNFPEGNRVLLRNICAAQLNKLICVEGVVKQITDVLPKIKVATWQCNRCGNTYKIFQTGQSIAEPSFCDNCRHRDFSLLEDQSEFLDYQKMQIQEPLEALKGSEQPTSLDVYLADDIVNKAMPGDSVVLVGILRLAPTKKGRPVFGRYLECIYVEQKQREFEEIVVTPEDEKKIRELAKDPEIYDKLIKSIAPNIYGHEDVKEAIVLQLFGGVKKILPTQQIRGNIHILLVGDPGVAKCVSGDTKILLCDGTMQRISELAEPLLKRNAIRIDDGAYAEANFSIPLMDYNGKLVNGKALRISKRIAKNLVLIKTQAGRELCVTDTHPLFICDSTKIKALQASKIKPGMFIAAPKIIRIETAKQKLIPIKKGKKKSLEIKMPSVLNRDVARLIGYLLAMEQSIDGKCNKIRFRSKEKGLFNDFKKIAIRTFGLRPAERCSASVKEITIESRDLAEFLHKNFPEIKAKNCKVPASIMRAPNDIAKDFLKAIIEAKGSVCNKKGAIKIASSSEELIDSLLLLLLRFGIVAKKEKVKNRVAKRNGKTIYCCVIFGEFAERYVKEIGFISERKCRISEKQNAKNADNVVPIEGPILRKVRRKLGLNPSDFIIPKATYCNYERGKKKPSRKDMHIIANVLLSKYLSSELYDGSLEETLLDIFKLARSDVFWDKVVHVKKFSKKGWVYDIETTHAHNFISNLLFSHNSQILTSANAIAPKSIYVGGKTTSGVGLTATAVKDEFGEGTWTLKAGALVLASGGIAMVDELDKMPAEERVALHEAMEQGTVSVAKAGIITRFKTDTSILAAANPKFSRFETYEPLIEQIDLPPTLISRFDLFFLIRDVLDKTLDREIANFILKTHRAGEKISNAKIRGKKLSKKEDEELKNFIQPVIEPELLRKYISFARQHVFPELSDEAMKELADFYVKLREKGKEEGSYAATHRQLEGLVRLSEASARVRLSDVVEKQDAERAIRLLKRSLKDVVTDPETGKIDIDLILTGQTHTQLENMHRVLSIIKEKAKSGEPVSVESILAEVSQSGITSEKLDDIINKLEKKGEIYRPKHGYVKPTQKD